jgi:quercetin dioxygenase-like cupin family protein
LNRRSLTRTGRAARPARAHGAIVGSPIAAAPAAPSARDLLDRIRALLESLKAPRLAPFLTDWPPQGALRPVTPATLPVLKDLPVLAAQAPAWARSVTDELLGSASRLFWGQSYPASLVGASFLENYGWTEIAGLQGPIQSEHLAVGFLMLGPATSYRRHRHEAEEIYVPLVGTAAWQGGSGAWREKPPGSVVVHERNEPHAMRTSSGPILALYLWRSADLNQKSRIDAEA